jgi:2-methylisocitrate lyase-like PEP mutase family enzyme
MVSKGRQLRELLKGPGVVIMPGVYDGFSARLVEAAGFLAAGISGAGLSETNLGWPDVGIMGYDANLKASSDLAACTSIPLLADGDTGYGNAVNVHFTVRGFEQAGLAGVMLEDQVWPKRCGHIPGKEVISAEEGVEKIRAAVDARRDRDFVIKARTDSAGVHGVREAIRRLNLYADAGADLLFADALLSAEDIALVASEVSKPLAVNMGFGIRSRPTTPLVGVRDLEAMGVKVIVYPRLLTAAAIQGMKHALATLAESIALGSVIERPDLAVSFQELNELVGLEAIQKLEDSFLTVEQLQNKYHRAALHDSNVK